MLNALVTGLPVIIVESWDEVTAANLEKWSKKYPEGAPVSAVDLDVWLHKLRQIRRELVCGGAGK